MIAAIYSRKSKFSEKGESVENQITCCEEYARKQGINNFVVYEDEGFSGGNTHRPQFQKMIKDAKGKKFTHLICYRLDRISRNVSDFSTTIEELNKYGIEFISVKEQFDTTLPMGRAMMSIAAVFAQLERETIAERIRDNMLELAKTGRWLGGTAPLGFTSEAVKYKDSNGKDKKMHKLIIASQEIETVKLIFDLYIEKKGFSTVASYLCKNHYKGKNGGEFSRQTVNQIISNPVYCIADDAAFKYVKHIGSSVNGSPNLNGFMVYNKRKGGKKENPISNWIFSVGKHPGVIASSKWIECQKINEYNKSKSSPRIGTGDKFLLSSMISCGNCGSGMSSWSHYNKKRNFVERYYRCNLKNRASNRCSNKMLNAYTAEEMVISYIKNLNIDLLIKNYDQIQNDIDSQDISIKEVTNYKKDIAKNNNTIQGLIRKTALLDDDLEIIKMFKVEINKIKYENLQIENNIKQIEVDAQKNNEIKVSIDEIISRIKNFKQFIDFADTTLDKRNLLLPIIQSIVWYGDTERIEINLIGSHRKDPRGIVLARNLLFRDDSR